MDELQRLFWQMLLVVGGMGLIALIIRLGFESVWGEIVIPSVRGLFQGGVSKSTLRAARGQRR